MSPYIESVAAKNFDAKRKLIELSTKGANYQCFECQYPKSTHVNLFNGTFVCCTCAVLLRTIFSHKAKDINNDEINEEDVEVLSRGGNKKATMVWLNKWKEGSLPLHLCLSKDSMILYLRLKYVDKVWALDTKIYESSPAPFRKRTSVSPTFSKTISSKPEQVGEYVLVRGSSQSHNLPEIKRESGIVKKQNVLYSDVFSFKEPRSDHLDSYVYNESPNNLVHFSEHSVLIADDKPTSRFIFNKTRRFLPKPEIPAVIEYKTTKRW